MHPWTLNHTLVTYLLDAAKEQMDFTARMFSDATGIAFTDAFALLVEVEALGWVVRHQRGKHKIVWRSAIVRRYDVGHIAEQSARDTLNAFASAAELRRALGKS